MGKRSQTRSVAASAWLPGFEPEGFELAQLDHPQLLITPVQAAPPSPPTAVAVAAAAVTYGALKGVPSVEARRLTSAHLEVVGEVEMPQEPEPQALEPAEPVELKDWPAFDAGQFSPPSGELARIKTNLAAIALSKQLDQSQQEPTLTQRHQLLAYLGWGGLARIFEDRLEKTLAEQRDQLKALLTPEEFASARASTPNAHYTDPVLVTAMWDIARQLGFRGGRVIDPAAGTGLFLAGMPADMAARSEITAVELDTVSGAILKKAFAGLATVHVSAIEKSGVPTEFYDACLTNVPFAEHKSLETRKVGFADFSLHNYFMCKSVELLRPGGLLIAITSRHTMDSDTSMHRKWLDAHAELVGAIRLPQGAFKKQANTEVVTDILIMRKRERPVFGKESSWIKMGTAPEHLMRPGQSLQEYSNHYRDYRPKPRPINRYFEEHPGMVIGELEFQSNRHGRSELVPVLGGGAKALEAQLVKCREALPEGLYVPAEPPSADIINAGLYLQRVDAMREVKPGSFVLHKGAIHISEGAEWIDVDKVYKGLVRQRVLGLIKVKEAARALLEQQALSEDDAEFKVLQRTLNVVYDAFVARHGNIASTANTRVFRHDPEFPLLLSLEVYDDDAEVYRKADIFAKRTVGKREPPATVDTCRDALLVSLAVYGRIVLPDMAKRLGVSSKAVVAMMVDEALAFVDPVDGQWKPADEYLSGHIRNKIAEAEAGGARFRRNAAALKAVLPKDLGPAEVEVRLGAPWVPIDVVTQFLEELINAPGHIEVSYSASTATWAVKPSSGWVGDRMLRESTWGTGDRDAVQLVEAVLNQSPPKVTRTMPNGSAVVDRQATVAAREKYEAIRSEFKLWAYRDDARRDRLLRIYNDEFNQIRNREWDGTHLLLPGMSKVIVPYRHQLDAVWRVVSGGNLLLAHVVGAGKTFVMAAACMELRRLGRARKPLIAVPNHLLNQVAGDVVRFYPYAKVLIASKEDLEGDRRREFVARIALGDWDAVVMTHSTFERLALRPATQQQFLDGLLDEARLALGLAQESQAKRSIKQTEKLIKALQAKLERAMQAPARDDFVYFDDLGIDFIMYDEAHLAKSLMRISKMPTVAGLPSVASNRAFDLWMKSSLIMQARGNKEDGLVLSTATPIANSVAEAFTMQKYLQPFTLKALGLYEFDAWAATFGETVQGMELAPDGSGYRLNSRFARFVNVPELMAIFRKVADIKTRAMITLPTPRVLGGKARTISSEPSSHLKKYTKELVDRATAVRNRTVSRNADNMLVISTAGRKAALDMRLIDPRLPFDPQGKMAQIRDQVVRIWKETAAQKGTQIVFCDLSTPSATGFSFYNDLRERLVAEGIPREEIEFIHDHESDRDKDILFRRVRAGQVRVLMGSTMKLGIGTNVQRRLKCVHQADPPWRPCDVEQRDGRAERPGNTFDEIELLRYVTRSSFDAYTWQLLTTKATFIDQVMNSVSTMRTIEDVAMGPLTYAEIRAIASGNPLVLKKAQIDAEVMRYSTLQDQHEQDRWKWSRAQMSNGEQMRGIGARLDSVKADAAAIAAEQASGWTFQPCGALSDRAEASEGFAEKLGYQILHVSRTMPRHGEALVGTVGGMRVLLSRYDGVDLLVQSRSGNSSYRVDRFGTVITDVAETAARVLQCLADLVSEPARLEQRLKRLGAENADIEARLQSPFEHEAKLIELRSQQRQIDAELDLDKDEEGAESSTDTEPTAEA